MSAREPAPFGVLLRRYRAAAHLTQEQIAAQAGLSPDAIAALERGKRRTPRGATVELLASALELDEGKRAQFLAAARAVGAAPPSSSAGGVERGAVGNAPAGAWQPMAEPTPLVDRVHELDMIVRLLAAGDVRLLTLVGPAGVGKTRLALEAAARLAASPQAAACFPAGIVFVDLAPVRDPALMLGAIARALGLLDVGSRTELERLLDALGERQPLLVLDNVEQVLPAAPALAQLLTACPGLHVLVTSRVPLRLRWERTMRVAPLPVPDLSGVALPLDELVAVPSVTLFVERARAHRADFALGERQAVEVALLAAQLDGLPLALELAAARLDVLPLTTIVHHLDHRLRLLHWDAADLPERQRSLEAAVGWSYDLLTEAEQRLFRHLGVFVGRVSPEAITSVVGGVAGHGADGAAHDGEAPSIRERETLDVLLDLAERSLILPARPTTLGWQGEWSDDDEAAPAFGMLETVREYAEERLAAAGELEAAQQAHARYYLQLAERADPLLRGRDQRAWYFRLEREHDNLRAALRWLLDQEAPAERAGALRLASALGWFWGMRGYHTEGARWLEEALARTPHGGRGGEAGAAGTTVRTMALCWAGFLLTLQGRLERAHTRLEEALSCARQRHDHVGIARALTFLGHCAAYAQEAEREQAVPLLHEAVRTARALGEPHDVAVALFFLGEATHVQGRATEAAAHYAEALDLLEAAGDARAAHIELGMIVDQQEDLPSALRHLRAALEASGRLRDRYLLSLGARAALTVLGGRGDPVGRARLAGAADALRQATGGGRVPWEPVGVDRTAAAPCAPLSEGEWEAAYREGRALPLGEVVRLALRLVDEVATSTVPAENETDGLSSAPSRHCPDNPLSAREREVLQLVAQGLSSKVIGQQLFLSPSTVKQHVKAIFNKLGVDTRAQAVAVAAQRGWLWPVGG